MTQAPPVQQKMRDLLDVYPLLPEWVEGKNVLDFGCGTGAHAIGIAMTRAKSVVGLDINVRLLEAARARAVECGVAGRVRFVRELGDELFDVVLSYNSMEHFADPAQTLRAMRQALAPDGRLLIAFSPPWLSAYGAHTHFFTKVPWVHLLFPERVVMAVRSRYRSDGATRYEEVEGGLNRMTLAKYERLVSAVGLRFERYQLCTTKKLPAVDRLPILREFLVSRVVSVLKGI